MSDVIHRFKVGQTVAMQPSKQFSAAPGLYSITRLMPRDSNEPQYCVKSQEEKHERVVPERELLEPGA
jgi:hypothetical protein